MNEDGEHRLYRWSGIDWEEVAIESKNNPHVSWRTFGKYVNYFCAWLEDLEARLTVLEFELRESLKDEG